MDGEVGLLHMLPGMSGFQEYDNAFKEYDNVCCTCPTLHCSFVQDVLLRTSGNQAEAGTFEAEIITQ